MSLLSMAGMANISSENFDDKVVSLLHFEGPNNSTVFTDEKGLVWSLYGTSSIVTREHKFGTSSLYNHRTNNGRIFTYSLFDVTTDFTVECYFNIYYEPSFYDRHTIFFNQGGGPSGIGVYVLYTNQIRVWFGDGTNYQVFDSSPYNFGYDIWYHFSITRDGNTIRVFVNGILLMVHELTIININNLSGRPACIGGDLDAPSRAAAMYFDDFRWTQACRYKKNFSPPTETLT